MTLASIVQALREVKPVDLVSGKTDISQVLKFARQVSRILANAKDVVFTEETAKELSYALIKIGCVSFDSIYPSYLIQNPDLTRGASALEKSAINLPADMWSGILLAQADTTNWIIRENYDYFTSWLNNNPQNQDEMGQ